jgi:stalled ribosome rescue protein Dom34
MEKKNVNQIGVWMDGHKAIVVKLDQGKTSINEINSDLEEAYYHEGEAIRGYFVGIQHNNLEKTIADRKKDFSKKFMKNVFEAIQEAEQLYIIGPGEMKKAFNRFIVNEHQKESNKVIGVESCDYLREKLIVDKIKHFFETV